MHASPMERDQSDQYAWASANSAGAARRGAVSHRPGTLVLVLLALALLVYYGYANLAAKPPPRPDATWTRILQEGALRVGVDPSFPPFEADDGKGNLSGLDIALAAEIAREWSQQHGVEIKVHYVYTGFDGLYDALRAGQFDVILSALPYDPKRTEDVRFTHAYYNGGPVVVVREKQETVKSWLDLASRRVGVELGSSGDAFARRWQRRLKYDLREFHTPADALQALRAGEVDGVLTDAIAYNAFLQSQGGVRVVGSPLVDELYVMAVRRDAPTLWEQINAVIAAMKRDGRMERLQAEWFGGAAN